MCFLGSVFFAFSKLYLNLVFYEYSDLLCIFEASYICKELENKNILVQKKYYKSIKQRIKKLSKLIYILGKHNNDNLGYYRAISKDISDKVNWLNCPKSTTIEDLKNYFQDIEYYLIIGKVGEIKIPKGVLTETKSNKIGNCIENTFKLAEISLSLLERIFALFKKIFTLFF